MCVTFFINAYKQHRRLLCVLSPRNGNKDLYEDEDMRFNVLQILEFFALGYILGLGPTVVSIKVRTASFPRFWKNHP